MDSQGVEVGASQVVGQQVAGDDQAKITMGRITGKICNPCRIIFIDNDNLVFHIEEIHNGYQKQIADGQQQILHMRELLHDKNRELDKARIMIKQLQMQNQIIDKESEEIKKKLTQFAIKAWRK